MARGRPVKSVIRDRIQSIVDTLGATYGYEILKLYQAAYQPLDIRSVYYHLNKGLKLGEFEEVGVKEEKGQFTWGDISIRKYYILGPNARKRTSPELKKSAEEIGLKERDMKEFIKWGELADKYYNLFSLELENVKKDPERFEAGRLVERIEDVSVWFEQNSPENLGRFVELKDKIQGLVK